MKKIKKKLLDSLIQESNRYWHAESQEPMGKRLEICKRISAECNVDWLWILHLIDAIVAPAGFAPNASEEVVYGALHALGWEVV